MRTWCSLATALGWRPTCLSTWQQCLSEWRSKSCPQVRGEGPVPAILGWVIEQVFTKNKASAL